MTIDKKSIATNIKKSVKNGKSFLFGRQEDILTAASIVSLTYLGSYILGFVKKRVLLSTFGIELSTTGGGVELGTFFLADRIPTLIFNVLVAGSVSTVFIPVFTKKIRREGKESAWELCSAVLNASVLIFLFFSIAIFLFTDQISSILTLSNPKAPKDLLSSLIRIMMVSQLVLIFSSFITSSLQSFRRFLIPALAPIFYNLGIIVFVVLFSDVWGIRAPAWGMVFGSVLHLGIQIPLMKKLGFKYSLATSFFNKDVKKVFSLALPRTVGIGADQLALVVDNSLAYFIAPPMVAILDLASSLQRLPVSIFGASLAQALFPMLSSLSVDDMPSFKKVLVDSIKQMMFLITPSSVVLLILRIPLVRLIFGVARFSWDATIATSYTLAFFSISVFAQGLIFILARAFYSLNDTKTPVVISIVSLIIGSFLSIYFVVFRMLGVWSLGLSYSVSMGMNGVLLAYFLQKKIGGLFDLEFFYDIAKILLASFFTGVALYIPLKILDQYLFDTTRALNLLILTLVVSVIGIITYDRLSLFLNVSERKVFIRFYNKLRKSFRS